MNIVTKLIGFPHILTDIFSAVSHETWSKALHSAWRVWVRVALLTFFFNLLRFSYICLWRMNNGEFDKSNIYLFSSL